LLAFSLGAGLRGQSVTRETVRSDSWPVGLYDNMARELPNGGCNDNDCFWTVEHLLTYYRVALDNDGLKGALRDPRADVRSMAADELAKKGVKEAIPWLADALSSERAAGTRLHFADSLAQLGDPRGVATLESLCISGGQSNPNAEVTLRLEAAKSLWQLHETTCNNCAIDLLRFLDRPGAPREFGIRTAAMGMATVLESLSESQAATIRQIADRWISDEDEGVRRIASRAVALYGDAASYQKLKAALAAEQDAAVRACMQTELGRLAGRLPGTSEK
jgi:hypothetical protein